MDARAYEQLSPAGQALVDHLREYQTETGQRFTMSSVHKALVASGVPDVEVQSAVEECFNGRWIVKGPRTRGREDHLLLTAEGQAGLATTGGEATAADE